MPKAQRFLAKPSGIHKRRFDNSPSPSARQRGSAGPCAVSMIFQLNTPNLLATFVTMQTEGSLRQDWKGGL